MATYIQSVFPRFETYWGDVTIVQLDQITTNEIIYANSDGSSTRLHGTFQFIVGAPSTLLGDIESITRNTADGGQIETINDVDMTWATFDSLAAGAPNLTNALAAVFAATDEINGNAGDDVLKGYDGADELYGSGGIDLMFGGAGDDFLDGGIGNDDMRGGTGNDTYVVNSAADKIVEAKGAAGGTADVVSSSVLDINLASFANVENATLLGSAQLNARGTAGANRLDGDQNSAANGLRGLNGNDTYVVGAGDSIVETATGGKDTVSSSTISLNLAVFANVENAKLLGNANLNLTGAGSNNALTGNAGLNVLTGAGGKDTLTGGLSSDIFDFDAVNHSLAGDRRDVIKDFSQAQDDHIDLSTIDANGSRLGDTFQFIGTAAFSGDAGELRIRFIDAAGSANDKTIIQGDTNGDRRPDFEIELTGLHNLTAGAVGGGDDIWL
jgi:Ca2+-binding RTX toxin-like protein